MAKYLGIDYGSKRVGIAVSDALGSMAFPKETIANDRTLLPRIVDLVRDENISTIVIGRSIDHHGEENEIMKSAREFALEIERSLAVTVYFEAEYYSSVEARRLAEEGNGKSNISVDAMAASVILNRYLERMRG